ncbi:MAG: hypothetical protein KBE22_02065 [Candidatus Accumulibacter sp.]|nr:hypothetical protein [Accumulibacter sp.]
MIKMDPQTGEGECIAARFVFVPPRIEQMCRSVAIWYMSRVLNGSPTESDIDAEQRLLMLSYSLRRDDAGREQVFRFPAVLGPDGISFKPSEELLLLIRDCEIHLQCAQAEDLWVDYLNFKNTQFPTVATQEALGQLLEDAQKKSLSALLSEHGYWKVIRLARGLVGALAASKRGSGGAG